MLKKIMYYTQPVNLYCEGRIQRGGGAEGPDPPPLKNHKNIGFLSNTGPDPQKITNLQSQQSTPAKRHLNHVSLVCRCWPFYNAIWIVPPL